MVQAIPGFYYGLSRSLTQTRLCIIGLPQSQSNISTDEEKKKYFKIQANHAAPPGSQYSKDSVKRKREDQEVGIPPSSSIQY